MLTTCAQSVKFDSKGMSKVEAVSADDSKRSRILEAALDTFIRFGFRKTSMEEVARAAGLSRQGLYLHYATKEELFRASVRHLLESGLAAVAEELGGGGALEARLVGALDAWVGRFVGMHGENMSDLYEATQQLVGSMLADHDEQFGAALTRAMRASGLAGAYKAVGIGPRQLAETLYATARGFKHSCATRAEFRERMSVAVRAMCLPLAAS
jgi:TetR/AcrR family transcriptional regulator of autoinduction and epiphytic fitness